MAGNLGPARHVTRCRRLGGDDHGGGDGDGGAAAEDHHQYHGLPWLVARSIWARTLPERARKRRAESPGAQCPTINFSPSDSPPPFVVSPNNIGSMSVRKSLGVPLFLPEWLRF